MRFFMTPCGPPDRAVLEDLFLDHDYWKGIPDSVLQRHGELLDRCGVQVREDRDNFDYLYLRAGLAELPGKKYHKKRNLVNAFTGAHACEERPLTADNIPHALDVLTVGGRTGTATGIAARPGRLWSCPRSSAGRQNLLRRRRARGLVPRGGHRAGTRLCRAL